MKNYIWGLNIFLFDCICVIFFEKKQKLCDMYIYIYILGIAQTNRLVDFSALP